jgi:SAM-dependent methyltransferase
MIAEQCTWEQAIRWLKGQSEHRELVKACFYDDPLADAAERYHLSTEWLAVQKLIGKPRGSALDLGAGRGISAYALAKDGWRTTALEPDPSEEVGATAIRNLARVSGLEIEVVETWGESLPFSDNVFDLVHCRQVLHHAHDLDRFCREAARVLKPGGCFIATREHVISRQEDLPAFLRVHPLHHLYGGENAFKLAEYKTALTAAGIRLSRVMNPLQTDINTFPKTRQMVKARIATKLKIPARMIPDFILSWWGSTISTPGRVYSFVGHKPAHI